MIMACNFFSFENNHRKEVGHAHQNFPDLKLAMKVYSKLLAFEFFFFFSLVN